METKKKFTDRFASFIEKRKWGVLIATIILGLAVGGGAKNLKFDGDYHAYFSETNPQLEAFDNLQEKYTKDESVIISLTPENGNLFTKENLSAIESMTADAWQIPYNSRVDALTNFQHTRADNDDLYVADLVTDATSMSSGAINNVKSVALAEPLLVDRLINKDGSVTAININIKLPGKSDTEQEEVSNAVREMLASWKESHPTFEYHTTGIVPMNTAFFESASGDSMTLIPIMFLVVLILIAVLTRSVTGTFASLLVIVLSISMGAGFAGLVGIKLTPPSSQFSIIILTLAVADSIHILMTIINKMKEGYAKKAAITESLKLNIMPVAITSVTTIIGFLSMNFGDVPPYWDLGNITAVGMLGALIFSLTTLPALIYILPFKVKKVEGFTSKISFYEKIGIWVSTYPKQIVGGLAVFMIAMGFLASKNVLNDEAIKYFDESLTFRQDSDYISKNLTGMYNLEYSAGSGESGGISNPEYLSNLAKFENWLKEQPEVIHVNSYAEIARRVNKSMHGDEDTYYKVPQERNEAAQYLLLYEMSLPFGLDLNNQLNVDKSETRVTVTTENMPSQSMIALNNRIEKWLTDNTPEYMHSLGSSTTLMFAYLGERQSSSITKGNIIALFLISLLLIIVLRNVKLGLLSIIPNIAPVIIGFGFWYLFSGMVNTGMIVVFGMTLGIVVDDTVHFLTKYLRGRRELGYNSKDSVVYAFSAVGKALMITTIILVIGFMVLGQSTFLLNSSMAQIAVIVMISALLIDFLLLPALLILVDGKKGEELTDARKAH
ncbi:MMPL family transporter [uncultured Aquimarina sp.]|uniref:efflux RND transporter permease subunit n=1 Tax=uncultured Aquimarina sp. TaxID=575652 RepID=UPI002625E911|nr:MMPL family transporter [uncultured Aquimarina sp.]